MVFTIRRSRDHEPELSDEDYVDEPQADSAGRCDMAELRHETVGDETSVYRGDRVVAVIRPDGSGLGLFTPSGAHLAEASHVEVHIGWLEAQMQLGRFPRRRQVTWGDVKVGDIWITGPPSNSERAVTAIDVRPDNNRMITFDDGKEILGPDSAKIMVVT